MELGKKEFAEIMAKLAVLEVKLDDNAADLKEHIRRTANLEGRTESIEAHVHQVQGAFKLIAWVGGILTVLATVGGVLVSHWTTKR
jgi:hypothetical protein